MLVSKRLAGKNLATHFGNLTFDKDGHNDELSPEKQKELGKLGGLIYVEDNPNPTPNSKKKEESNSKKEEVNTKEEMNEKETSTIKTASDLDSTEEVKEDENVTKKENTDTNSNSKPRSNRGRKPASKSTKKSEE